MSIEEFHEMYWGNTAEYARNHMYYRNKPFDVKSPNYTSYGDSKMTPYQIEMVYDSVNFDKFNMKKFTLGEYTFYGFGRTVSKPNSYENQDFFRFGFYMDYHGYRITLIRFEKEIFVADDGYDCGIGSYNKSYEGLVSFLSLLDNPDIVLEDYKLEELCG